MWLRWVTGATCRGGWWFIRVWFCCSWFVGVVNIGFVSCDQGDFGYVKSWFFVSEVGWSFRCVGWFVRLWFGWGVGDFIVVFPLDSTLGELGLIVGLCGLFGCVVYGEWFGSMWFMSVSSGWIWLKCGWLLIQGVGVWSGTGWVIVINSHLYHLL